MKIYLPLALLLFTGCSTKFYNYKFRLDEPTPTTPLMYENDSVKVMFTFTPDLVGFTIYNKLADGIKINWDEVSLSIAGRAYRVIHKETGLTKTTDLQPPTTIPPRSRLVDAVVPTNYIRFAKSGNTFTLVYSGMFPNYGTKKVCEKIMRRKGEKVILFIPFRIADKYVANTFYFTIEDIYPSKKKEF